MLKAALGTKRRCLGCNTAFFDLRHDPIVCPKCQTTFVPPAPPPMPPNMRRKTIPKDSPAHAPEVTREKTPEMGGDDDEAEILTVNGANSEPDDDILPLDDN